ncbi:MAG: hypothetical protein HY290_33515 [Planctomycetia bacterium]|nr:hypothetical protein [Planctomycetia bacterium]
MGASSGAIRAGKAYVEIYGDDNPLQKKLNGVSTKLKSWGGSISSLGTKVFAAGAAVKGALGGAIAVFEEAGTQLRGMSLRTGASVEALSTLGFVAEQSGVDMEGLETGIRKMQKVLGGADEGSAEAAAALDKLGLSIDQLKGLSPDEQFRRIGARLAAMPDPTLRAAEAMKIFGKSGTSLLPMLAHGAEGMAELEDQARSLGLEWSGHEAESAAKLHHAMGALWAVIKKGTANVGSALADDLRGLVVSATQMAAATGKWIKENKGLVVGLNLAAGAVLATGAALIVLGTVLTAGGTVLGTIGTVMAAILSPTTLVIAAVVGLGAALLHYSGVGKAALGWLSERFAELKADAEKTFKGISDALSAGDIKLAMKILWLSLQVEWQKGINFLKGLWRGFKVSVIDIGLSIGEGLAAPLLLAFAEIQKAWIDLEIMLAKGALKVAAATKGIQIPDMAFAAIDAAGNVVKANVDQDAERRRKAIPGVAAGMRMANAAGAVADAAADQRRVEDLERARDAAIALAAANRKNGDGGAGAGAHGFDADAATASKHGPIAGVDVKSAEGFKSVLTAVNEGRNNPAADSALSLRQMAALQRRQERHERDTLAVLRRISTVGF